MLYFFTFECFPEARNLLVYDWFSTNPQALLFTIDGFPWTRNFPVCVRRLSRNSNSSCLRSMLFLEPKIFLFTIEGFP